MRSYKRYLTCLKCKRRFGTDHKKIKSNLCPICIRRIGSIGSNIKGGLIKKIKDNKQKTKYERKNNYKN